MDRETILDIINYTTIGTLISNYKINKMFCVHFDVRRSSVETKFQIRLLYFKQIRESINVALTLGRIF
jgi:hypothetical protein